MLFHKKTFIFAPENEMWKDLSSLQPQKKNAKTHPFLTMLRASGYACLLTTRSPLFIL